jgi:hypothetical protein
MSLADVQRRLAAALLSGEMSDVADLFDGRRRPPRPRLDLYCDSVLAGLAGVLSARFPETRRRLGDTVFAAAARDFARLHPPRSPLLGEFGLEFPAFLASDGRPFAERSIADTARREWSEPGVS